MIRAICAEHCEDIEVGKKDVKEIRKIYDKDKLWFWVILENGDVTEFNGDYVIAVYQTK